MRKNGFDWRRFWAMGMLLSMMLTACGTKDSGLTDDAKMPQDTELDTISEEPVPENSLDTIGDFDFDGASFRILSSPKFFFSPYDVEEENGELLNDKAYQRNREMEDRYGVKMEYVMAAVDNGDGQDTANELKRSVSANDGLYTISMHSLKGLTGIISGGYTYDWNKIPHVKMDEEYWNQSIREELTIGQILPCASSDFVYFNAGAIYFNKEILNACNLESPYPLVYNGKWTWDKLGEMAAAAAYDINGDGTMSEADDRFGYSIINNHRVVPVSYSCDILTASMNENGYPVLDNMFSEKMTAVVEMYYKLLYENAGTLRSTNELNAYREGRVLFLHYVVQNIEVMRDVDFDFGILPLPKFDETQPQYVTMSQSNVMCIPADITNTEMAGVISEALAIYSHEHVLPALYETAYNYKYLRDEDSIAMFDIIQDTLVYDVLWFYGEGDPCTYFMQKLMADGSTDVASFYQANHAATESRLAEFYDIVLNKQQ